MPTMRQKTGELNASAVAGGAEERLEASGAGLSQAEMVFYSEQVSGCCAGLDRHQYHRYGGSPLDEMAVCRQLEGDGAGDEATRFSGTGHGANHQHA